VHFLEQRKCVARNRVEESQRQQAVSGLHVVACVILNGVGGRLSRHLTLVNIRLFHLDALTERSASSRASRRLVTTFQSGFKFHGGVAVITSVPPVFEKYSCN